MKPRTPGLSRDLHMAVGGRRGAMVTPLSFFNSDYSFENEALTMNGNRCGHKGGAPHPYPCRRGLVSHTLQLICLYPTTHVM